MFASVIISAGAAKRLKGGYPWVFSRDILSRRFQTAGVVGVLDKKGEFLGQAFYSPASKIVLRLITKSKVKIDKNFWVERVRAALKRRLNNFPIPPLPATTTLAGRENGGMIDVPPFAKGGEGGFGSAFRVAYAESDGMPSIIIDKYSDIVSFQITSAGAETVREDIVAAIAEVLRPAAIIEKNNIQVRKLEGLQLIERVVFGDKTVTIVTEGDQRFEVDVLHGQKTGAYLDYRGFRLNPPFVKGGTGGILALDLFCYQGWMACHLAKNFAKVVAVDASQEAINIAERNAMLNGHKNIDFICADAFEYLRGQATFYPSSIVEKKKVVCPLFDLIHLDPPPFAKGHKNLPVAIKAYKKMIIVALKLLKPKGIFFVSSCSHHISEGALEKIVQEAAKVSGSKFQVIYRGIQDKDHPVLKGFPESLYLKAIAIQIMAL